jgi:hypothetical protein
LASASYSATLIVGLPKPLRTRSPLSFPVLSTLPVRSAFVSNL